MSILWFALGVVAGLFIPTPLAGIVKGWITTLWNKTFNVWPK